MSWCGAVAAVSIQIAAQASGFPPSVGGPTGERGLVRVCPMEQKTIICGRDFDEPEAALCLQQSTMVLGQEQAQMSWCTCPPNTARSETGRECIAVNQNEFCSEQVNTPFQGSWTYFEGAIGRMCVQQAGFATRKADAQGICSQISGAQEGVSQRATLPSFHSPPEWHSLHTALVAATTGSSIWQAWLGAEDVRDDESNDSVLVWDDGSDGKRQEMQMPVLSLIDSGNPSDSTPGQWIPRLPCRRLHVPWGFGQPLTSNERCLTLQQLALPSEAEGGIGSGFDPLNDGVLTSQRMLVGGRLCSNAAEAPPGTDDTVLEKAQISGLVLCTVRVGATPELIEKHIQDSAYCSNGSSSGALTTWMIVLIAFGVLMAIVCFWVCVTAPWDRLYPDPKEEELRRTRRRKLRKRVKKMEENRRASAIKASAVAPMAMHNGSDNEGCVRSAEAAEYTRNCKS